MRAAATFSESAAVARAKPTCDYTLRSVAHHALCLVSLHRTWVATKVRLSPEQTGATHFAVFLEAAVDERCLGDLVNNLRDITRRFRYENVQEVLGLFQSAGILNRTNHRKGKCPQGAMVESCRERRSRKVTPSVYSIIWVDGVFALRAVRLLLSLRTCCACE